MREGVAMMTRYLDRRASASELPAIAAWARTNSRTWEHKVEDGGHQHFAGNAPLQQELMPTAPWTRASAHHGFQVKLDQTQVHLVKGGRGRRIPWFLVFLGAIGLWPVTVFLLVREVAREGLGGASVSVREWMAHHTQPFDDRLEIEGHAGGDRGSTHRAGQAARVSVRRDRALALSVARADLWVVLDDSVIAIPMYLEREMQKVDEPLARASLIASAIAITWRPTSDQRESRQAQVAKQVP